MNEIDWKNTPGACRMIDEFDILGVIGSGTYGVVYKASRKSNKKEVVALKEVLMVQERDGLPITTAREVKLLSRIQHPNIVSLIEVAVGPRVNEVFLVLEYLDYDLAEILDSNDRHIQKFTRAQIKCLLYQLLNALDYLHSNWIIHRDIKMANLLYNNETGQLKLTDFGLARTLSDVYEEPLTFEVVTLWYRAPELLVRERVEYGISVDMWSVGCIMGELYLNQPIFPGKDEVEQINMIIKQVGWSNECPWLSDPRVSDLITSKGDGELRKTFRGIGIPGLDLLTKLLRLDPAKRISAKKALVHQYFTTEPLPASLKEMPSFPPKKVLPAESVKKGCDTQKKTRS
ncbi:uncharacterized protein LOC126326561 [Schistocerca gregaria]|uniref:uncharacterized protein LOC126326561 n=1 Tax=Schistocerca gregaria TaxID=7010 RepID=UPI00211DB346|nr:uncharacterized protein LOC126326561 [Schistocerca gregaria]